MTAEESVSASATPDAPDIGPPVVAAGARFQGLLVLTDPARIDGSVKGEIIAAGPLWISSSARVRARVEADEVIVGGQVVGTVEARTRIELLATARVRGELVTPRISLADGCVLEGRCRTREFGHSETTASP